MITDYNHDFYLTRTCSHTSWSIEAVFLFFSKSGPLAERPGVAGLGQDVACWARPLRVFLF